ncbi:MAG: DNA-processing protein DprA [Candidatus Electrothrix sp. GW3-4]|uniref:DNA-processing protein DprA n=1 Tax=Candidatus Electrothrix sp. GW3-4 TaxID=3126740 RepID=UPI0030D0DA6D
MEGRNDIQDWLALIALPGLGCVLARRLLAAFGTPGKVLKAGKAVAEVPGIGRNLVELFSSPSRLDKARFWAEQECVRVHAQGIQLLCCDDPLYPSLLLNIHDYPLLLYCLGNIDCLCLPAVAVVGSRTPTNYGKGVSVTLAQQLVRKGLVVVSGLAKGIDGQAHIGALEAGGKTIAVLGCGLDVVYPGAHGPLYKQIGEQGLLMSEYPLGSPPEGFRFPARNRIVSGLSLGVVIVEAAVRSGALITARLALEQNREVFAVPGRIDSPKSSGPHGLLRQGATLVCSVEDILAELPPVLPSQESDQVPAHNATPPVVPKDKTIALPDDLSEEERALMSAMKGGSIDIEQLSELSALPLNTLHVLLLGLELRGLIRQLPGQQYVRS